MESAINNMDLHGCKNRESDIAESCMVHTTFHAIMKYNIQIIDWLL